MGGSLLCGEAVCVACPCNAPAYIPTICGKHTGSPINDAIAQANLMPHLRRLLVHPDAGVRARVCNLIGNMCRHSGEALCLMPNETCVCETCVCETCASVQVIPALLAATHRGYFPCSACATPPSNALVCCSLYTFLEPQCKSLNPFTPLLTQTHQVTSIPPSSALVCCRR